MNGKHRYMIVEHPAANEQLRLSNGKILGKQPLHDLVSNYHWARIDATHVLMKAGYNIRHHNVIHSHPLATVLPTFGSSKPLAKHVTNSAHLKAIKSAFSITDTCTVEDLIDKLVKRNGPLFSM